MKAPAQSVRKPAKAKAKTKTSDARPAQSVRNRKSSPMAGTKTKAGAKAAKAVATGGKAAGEHAASRLIDQRIRDLGGWRGETLSHVRTLILQADPEMTEESKWAKAANPLGVPVWSHHGIVCTGETYKELVKLTFARGAALADPARLFNSSLEGNTRRAIDIREGETLDARAFKALVKAAVALNAASKKR